MMPCEYPHLITDNLARAYATEEHPDRRFDNLLGRLAEKMAVVKEATMPDPQRRSN